jgi:hypothetical protein
VVGDARAGGAVGLIDVDAVDRAAEHGGRGEGVFGRAAGGVVEYEDAGGASAGRGC